MDYPSITGQPEKQIRPRKKRLESGLAIILAIILWVGMVCGGFYLAKQYIDKSVSSIQQTNAQNIKALQDRIDTLNTEMQGIEKTLGNAGLTLSNSDTTQKNLNQKIEQLDKQLQELEKSLQILKEAP